MAVTIRLSRVGSKKRPAYRIVVTDSRTGRDGKSVDQVGFYDPMPSSTEIRIDEEKVLAWLKNGATISDAVRSILRKQGVLRKWAAIRSGKPLPEEGAEEQAGAAKPEAPVKEAPPEPQAETAGGEKQPPEEAGESAQAAGEERSRKL